MTELEAKRINTIVERFKQHNPTIEGHEGKLRKAFAFAVNELSKQDPHAPGAFTPDAYLTAVENSLPRKEEEPSDVSRGSSMPEGNPRGA